MEFVGTFWALIPPIVAIVLALITKETFSSLFVGILVGAILLACQVGDPVSTLDWIINGTFTPNVSGDTALEAAGALALVPDGGGDAIALGTFGEGTVIIDAATNPDLEELAFDTAGTLMLFPNDGGEAMAIGTFAQGASIVDPSTLSSEVGIIPAISGSAGIFVFLVILGMMVALINAAGSSAAFGQWAAKHVKTRAGSLLATFFLGVLLFIDDYFNCLTVGAVMRPVTDGHKISRAKLSYIIDATAAPICMIAPVSSWAAAVSDTASSLDTGVSGIQLFIEAIPFNFYSLFTIVFVIAIACLGFDYGPMAQSELAAYRDGELGSLGNEDVVINDRANLIDMFLPVIVLIVTCIIGMLYVGGFWAVDGDYYMDAIGAFGNTDAGVALPWGSIIALVFTFIYFLLRRVVEFPQATECFVDGFRAMVPAILILAFALTLKSITGALGAASFVGGVMEGATGLYAFLPALIFLVALGLAFATGTSWGTFGILIPIVVAVFPAESTLLVIGISACLAGAVCGDHISPISDTTVMASAGANVNHLEHVSTQIPYALTVAAISFLMFLVAGFVQNAAICLAVGAAITVATVFVLRSTVGKKSIEDRKAAELGA